MLGVSHSHTHTLFVFLVVIRFAIFASEVENIATINPKITKENVVKIFFFQQRTHSPLCSNMICEINIIKVAQTKDLMVYDANLKTVFLCLLHLRKIHTNNIISTSQPQ
jgi:hypothetical protein